MSPDRFRWSPTNVPEQDKDLEITDEALEEDHEIDLDAACHHAYSMMHNKKIANQHFIGVLHLPTVGGR
jgi:hypothetical protein